MKNVLIVGAGRLGKGFVGETFFNAGWSISFLDSDPKVIEELKNKGRYTVRVHKTDAVVDNVVKGYEAFNTDDSYEVMDKFLQTDLIMFPLYPKDFESAAKYLSKCFEKQYEQYPDKKKTLICLTNKNHIIPQITKYFRENLDNVETRNWFDKHVIIRDSIVRRSTDAETNYSTNLITTAVASLLIQSPVSVDFSDVKWLELRENIGMLKDIKVFTINGPHAATAYYGYLKGYETIPEASNDLDIAQLIKGVHDTTVEAVMKEYPVTREEIKELEYLPEAKNEMPDSISRVAYDPIRKLSPHDRFMGVVDLCKKHNLNYDAITKAMACGFAYKNTDDKNSLEIQSSIQKKGIEETVARYIGEESNDEVVVKIVQEYRELEESSLINEH